MYEITEIMSIDVNNVWNCENNWTVWTFKHIQGVYEVPWNITKLFIIPERVRQETHINIPSIAAF